LRKIKIIKIVITYNKINKIWNKKIIFLVINNKKKAMIKYCKKERKGES
jgi:hypothetical protein